MSFVLDASLALSWCFGDESTPYTNAALDALQHERAVVPSLWFYEVNNGILTGIRRGRIAAGGAADFVTRLSGLPIEAQGTPAIGSESAEALRTIALEQKLSAYDAAYLVVAIELGLPLATLDGTGRRTGLKQAAERCSVKLFEPRTA